MDLQERSYDGSIIGRTVTWSAQRQVRTISHRMIGKWSVELYRCEWRAGN